MPTVLLTGGSGFIGSHTCLSLLEFGYNVIVIDSNINSQKVVLNRVFEIYQRSKKNKPNQLFFIEGDIRDYELLDNIFKKAKSKKIGMVGGYAIGEVNRLFHAFMNGARSVKPDIQFKVTFIGSWYDPPKAKEAAFAQIEAGVDIMYAERAGVVDACREKGILAFGNVNDMNKEENGTDVVVTSALWHMESAINHAISLTKAGNFKADDILLL